MAFRCHLPLWSLGRDKGVSNDGNDLKKQVSVDLSLVSMKPLLRRFLVNMTDRCR